METSHGCGSNPHTTHSPKTCNCDIVYMVPNSLPSSEILISSVYLTLLVDNGEIVRKLTFFPDRRRITKTLYVSFNRFW